MTTNSMSLLIVGLLVLGALVCIIVKVWRYCCNHFGEMYRPCNGLLGLNCKSVIVAMLTLSALVWGNGLMGQDGTQTHPYPIKDKEALVTLAQCINTGHNFKFENDMFVVDPSGDIPAYGMGTYFQQTDNIDMLNESNWFTIGNSLATGFQGVYLGNGKKIQNLTLTADKPALFCYPNGRIVNLTIENPVFSGTINCGGALATFVMGGTIDSCHVTGHNMVFNGKDCGALIGWVGIPDGEKAGEVTISNCSNSCNITSNYQQESYTDYYNSVAGVVACIRAHRYHVTRCFNTGNIVSTYRPLYQKDMICFAGVVGRGILPYLSSDITYCYNTGDITAHCGYLGGVAGFFDEEVGVTNYTRCTIDYCFNTGDITGIPVLHVDNPTAYIYADTNIDVFSLGGVVAPSKTKTRYCFNTGNVTLRKHPHPRFTINGDQGVAGVGSSAEHCFNVGEITNYNLRNGRAAGVSRDTANHCFNAACVDDRNPRYTFSPHNIAQVTLNSVSDAQMSVDGQDGNLYSTGKLMGEFSSVKNCLGEEHWIYETGLYPRLKWTDTCAWARDIAIVASTPILLSDTLSDIRHVTSGLQLTGCDKGVVWKAPAGNCLFVNSTLEGETCIDNASFHSIQPAMQSICNDPVTVAATWNGDTVKTVTLIRRVAATLDTIPINSLAELKALRDGINTGEAFFIGGRKFPRYAEGVTFRLTVDLDMQNEKPWIPIGSVFSGSRFSGTFLGDGHIIDNLSLDDDSVYFYRNSNIGGLFGMLSGEVRDLHFTNLTANSTTIVAGAVCALMNGGTIENCIVEGNIETTTSNNNFAISGIGGIAGVSLTAHTQDNTLTCRDTIRNCVNYADIITHVRRGTNIASHSAGGIIGHGGVVIDCANAGDISGGAECGYIGGIGGDLTSALRCFNTGRISIAKSPQSIDYYVGGVVGINGYPHTVQYCYNAGPVDGSDRNHVGGIMGEGNPEYCYLSNTVTSTGKHLGSITASSPNSPTHCYYDNQMSPIGGTNGTDHTSQTEGLTTSDMLGNALQGQLGDNENWEFTEDLYPQLSRLSTLNSQFPTLNSKFSTLSRTSVMPVLLSTDQTWSTAHDDFSIGGCDEHHFWKKIRGSVDVNGCNVIPGAHSMGVLEFAATYDSVPYRHITLKYNLDEDHALIIKNAMQFDSMRMVINKTAGGYYKFSDSTYHLNIPSGADHNDFIAILDGGNERFFKLISDIDLSGRNWIPIGGSEEGCCDLYRGNPFKGTFDGCGYTIRNLDVFWTNDDPFSPAYPNYLGICNRYQGLFGTIEGGTVKNLRFIQNDGNKSISNSALLCAVNRGTLYNCVIDSCVLTVAASKYSTSIINMDTVSLLCAVNDGGLIDSCRVKNSQIVINKNKGYPYSVIGGVCGLNQQGTVQNCQVSNLYFEELRSTANTPATQAVGGICGINFHGQLLNDTIKNSLFLFSASLDHQNIGGICGINGNDDKDENRYTDIPSIVENCLSDSTIIRCDTCIQGSTCKKMAMNFGGIVGMSQGHIVQINSCSTTAGSRLEVVADSVGGICGRFVGLGDQSLISDCDNYAPVKGYGYVGGIVGVVTNATLKNNHNSGNVWSAWDANFENQKFKPSGYYAGGIAGACIHQVVVKTCANNAKIKADSSYVGGIAGTLLNSCELINCTNNGLGDNEPDVSGINQVGGLVGLFGEDAWFGNGCENHGTVKGIAQVGGLVGYAKEGHLQCEGNNDGTVQGSSMTGCVYGYAEDPSLFEECASNQCQAFPHPQTINTANDLIAVRNAVNDGSNSYEGWTILLNEDLIFNGTDWIPIGTPEHPFRGTFNGQNHSIHFHINAPNSDYQGLFGYMQGTVTNLYLDNCSVIGHDYVGGIAGYCYGTISSCGTKFSCAANSKVSGNKYVGGLVGMARYSEMFNNQNGSNVTGNQYVGGLVGDFVAYKNDNCYGEMQYNIYGGYVSRCFNFGMVKATNNDSYVGGIAGSTSTEVNHSYNSGIVDGEDKVGGIAGLLDGDSIHHCYNVGFVSATDTNKGAICGIQNSEFRIQNCLYDRQMCTVEDVNATARYTREMTGEKLKSVLGNDNWTYNNNEYPKIKYGDDIHSKAAIISVKPLLLPGYMPVDDILQNFAGATGNTDVINISWSHYGNAIPTIEEDIQHLPGRDSIKLNNCGMDTLKVQCSNPCEHRLVPIKVTGKDALVTTDTTCSSSYTWSVNNVTYDKSGFYTYGDNCYTKYALNLTIGNISCEFDTISSTCSATTDGVVIPTVSGGFGNGFRYKWTNSNNDSISNQPYLTNITSGTYTLTVTDSIVSRCSYTGQITLGVQQPLPLTIAGCSESKPYDGTELTGSRFVVTEAGHAPDTVAANQFALLSNGDTLQVALASGSIVEAGTLSDTVIIKSYSIKNVIDHSCHYTVTTDTGSLTVTPRPVVIIVNDASKEVGDDDPTFTGSVPGLIHPNDLGTITYSRENLNIEEVGNYPDVLTASYTENSNYSVSVNKGDFQITCRHLTTKISNWPEAEITGIDECFYPAANNLPSPNTDTLPSAAQIQTWIAQANSLTTNDFTIAIQDTALKSSACDWQWARIYTISTTNTGYCDVESRVLYVSGGDQSAPVHSDNYLWIDGTVYQDACLASFDIDKFLPQDDNLFDDCSPMTITHTDTRTGDDHYGWTIRRSYVVTDACGHTIYDTIEVSGRDQTPPKASNSMVKNDTLWADYVQCLCDSIHVINDFDSLKTLFGLSDECTGNDISLVSKTRTFKTGNCCADTVVVAYTVADPYGNDTTFYHAQIIQDTTRPTFDIVPKDIALCLLGPGLYKETVYSVIYDENNQVINRVANIHDNCTKLQGSFVVHDSIDSVNYTVVNGIRQYEQYWTVTDSCGNAFTDKMIIKVNPLPTIRIDTLGTQTIIYGEMIQDITIYNEYSTLSVTLGEEGLTFNSIERKVSGWLDSVGTYSYTATAMSNQTPSCGSVDTVIKIYVNPRPITIAAGSATKKYDGTPLTSPYYECTVIDYDNMQVWVPILNVDSIAGLTITGSQTDVGSSANVPSNAVITRRTDASVNMNSSYAVSYANGTLTVTTNDTLITVVPGSGSKVYDGTPLTKTAHEDFTVTGVPEDLTWEATADGTVTNVTPGEGEKAVNAVTSFKIFDAEGHDVTGYFTNIDTSATDTLTITPKPLTITAASDTKVYDGTALTKNSYTHSDLAPGDSLWSVTVTGSQTIAGNSDNVPSAAVIKNAAGYTVTANYNITYENGTLEVTQKPFTITAGDSSKVYDGSYLTKNSYTHTDLAAGDFLQSVTITGKNALVGESSNVPSDAVIKNAEGDTVTNSYNIHYVNGTLRIKVKALTITTRDSSKVYDGTELICHTYTCTGLCVTDSIKYVNMPSKITYAGTIDNVIGSVDIVNHNNISIAGKDTDVTNCYQIQYIYGKLAVAKKDLTITADSATKMYDGTPLTKKSYTHSELVPGDYIETIFITGSQTVAGSSYNVPEGARIDNNNDPVTESYNITYVNGTLTVTPKPLTITADGATKEYDGTPLTKNTYTHTELISTDHIDSLTVTGSQTLVGSSNNVPSAAVIKNDTNLNITACYDITYANGTLKVTPNTSNITVVPSGGSKEYDGTPLTKTADTNFTVTGVPEGFTWKAKADGTVTNVVPTATEKSVNAVSEFIIYNANNEDVTNQFSNINTSAIRTLAITPKTLTLTSGSKTREYNGTELTNAEVENTNTNGLTVENGWITGEGATYSFSGTITTTGSVDNSFSYTLNGNTTESNYDISKTEGTLTITPSTKELKVVSAGDTWTYDGNAHTKYLYTVTYGENESYTVTVAENATTGTATLSTGDVVTITPAASAKITHVAEGNVTNAFSYLVENSDQYSNKAKFEDTLKVTPVDLTIVTNTASKVYDGTSLTATGNINGFVTPTGGSEETVTFGVTGSQLMVGSSQNGYSLVWDGTAVESDYSLSESLGTLTVTPASILVKANAQSKVYGSAEPTLTATVTGVVANEDFTPNYTVSRVTGDNVGKYIITPSGDTAQGNYIVAYDTALLTITPASLLVKADAQSKVYGTSEPTLTATVTGVVAGDNFTPIYSIVRPTGENIGQYIITPSGDTVQGNYFVSYDTSLLTITPASLQVKADAKSKVYGDNDPTLTATITGLVMDDEESIITYSLNRATGEDVGKYVITPSGESAQGNYTVTYDTSLFKITHKILTITADSESKVYDGTALTNKGYSHTALAMGDTIMSVVVTGSQLVVGTSDNVPSAAAIENAAHEDVTTNYAITYANGTLEVTQKAITITADNATKVYDSTPLIKDSYTHTALATGDTIISVTVTGSQTVVGSCDNVPSAAVIKNATDEVRTDNYAIIYVNGTLEVNCKEVTIKANDGSKKYDGTALTEGGFTASALESTDPHVFAVEMTSASTLTYVGTQANVIATVDGVAVSTGVQTVVGNYCVTTQEGTLTVSLNNLPIVITSGDREFNYDGQAHTYPSYSLTYDGFQIARMATDSTKFTLPTGDVLSVTNPASITNYTENAPYNNTFTYTIENEDNYNASAWGEVNGTISINVRSYSLQISSLGQSWTYDGDVHNYKHYTVRYADEFVTGTNRVNDTVFVLPAGDTLTITDAPSITNVGELANTFSYTLQHDALYIGSRDTIIDTLRVNPLTGVEVTVKEHGGETTYDGFEQRVSGYDLVSISNTLYTASDFYYSGVEEDSIAVGRYVGSYPMNILPSDFTNDNPNFADVIFTIEDSILLIKPNPAVITITAGSTEKLYDGTPLVDSSYTYTPAGVFAQGDSLVVEISGMISGVGQVDNEIVDYKVYRNESFNGSMVHPGLRMAQPTGYTKDVTDCYTFAAEMVKGKLSIYEALTLTIDTMSSWLCSVDEEGSVAFKVTGGKPATPRYHYQVVGEETHDTYTGTSDSTFSISTLKADTYAVTVTESLGYTITTSFVIAVREVITTANSTFVCPADIDTIIQYSGCHLELLNLGTPEFSTTTSLPLDEITISNNAPADHLYPVGETVVTWVAKSLCGDSITCEQKIKVSFSTCPDAVDYEGTHYPSVRLGSGCTCWTTENLKSTRYADGRTIEDIKAYSSSAFPNTAQNVNVYGNLYTWYAAADTMRYGSVDSVERAYQAGHRIQGICPEGWYLPGEEDFDELNDYPASELRSSSYWLAVSGVSNTNASGFNALPGGMYNCATDRCESMLGNAYFWSCHPVFDKATGAMIDYVCEKIWKNEDLPCNGYSVRCVLKDPR